jgi:hypothetical protein
MIGGDAYPVALRDSRENDLCFCHGEAVTDANAGAAAERQIGEAMAPGHCRRREPLGLEVLGRSGCPSSSGQRARALRAPNR